MPDTSEPAPIEGPTPTGRVTVIDPALVLTVTMERMAERDEVHLHAGGQGIWVARMAAVLGARTTLVTCLGGESGAVVEALALAERFELRTVAVEGESAVYVHDRREGERTELVRTAPSPLRRHEFDDLSTAALAQGLAGDVAVLAGPLAQDLLPLDFYAHLASNLRTTGITVVTDVAGAALAQVLDVGVDILKVSHEELISGGWSASDAERDLLEAIERIAARAELVVVSRGADPALAAREGCIYDVVAPDFTERDHRGAGDSMTAALAAATALGEPWEYALALGVGAGAANVTRHGLGTGDGEMVREVARRVELQPRA